MLLFRYGPEGFHAAGASLAEARVLYSDPLATPVAQWELCLLYTSDAADE